MTQKESTIYLPIKINLQPYFNETEKSLPKTFNGKEDNCSGVSYSYKFTRNPIEFEGKGDYMYYEVDGTTSESDHRGDQYDQKGEGIQDADPG